MAYYQNDLRFNICQNLSNLIMALVTSPACWYSEFVL